VRLSDGGAPPVDAKVPLDAYPDAAEADSEQEREAHLERHLAHVRAKVRELGSRAYHARFRRPLAERLVFHAQVLGDVGDRPP
jgi:DNA recombination protein RmuC